MPNTLQYNVQSSILKKPDGLFHLTLTNMSARDPAVSYVVTQNVNISPAACLESGEVDNNVHNYIYVEIDLNVFIDEFSTHNFDGLVENEIKVPEYVAHHSPPMQNSEYIRTLVFPSYLARPGDHAYIAFYCNQVQQPDQIVSSRRLFGTCMIYVAHLLREKKDLLIHLLKTDGIDESHSTENRSKSLSFFNSWRTTIDVDGEPGVSTYANDSELCTEPAYCDQGKLIQQRIFNWQNPPVQSSDFSQRTCDNSKFLIYHTTFKWASIGSWIHQTAWLLKYAICHDRILLMPTKGVLLKMQDFFEVLGPSYTDYTPHIRWFHEECMQDDSVFDCYFKPLSSCKLNFSEYFSSLYVFAGTEPDLELSLTSDAKYVSIGFIPFTGSCSISSKFWSGSFKFFDNLNLGLARYVESANLYEWGAIHDDVQKKNAENIQYGAFAVGNSAPMHAQLLRYLLRPRRYVFCFSYLHCHSIEW